MKYLLILFLLACNYGYPPTTKIITHYDTVVRQRIDTLVVIQTYDTIFRGISPGLDSFVRETGCLFFITEGSREERPFPLFKDGKRSDTIRKHTMIYQ